MSHYVKTQPRGRTDPVAFQSTGRIGDRFPTTRASHSSVEADAGGHQGRPLRRPWIVPRQVAGVGVGVGLDTGDLPCMSGLTTQTLPLPW